MGQQGFWDALQRYEKLERNQDLLVRLGEIIPWQDFRGFLEPRA